MSIEIDDVLAVDRRRLLLDTAGDGKAVFPALGGVGARRAGENVVVLQLKARDALAVDIAVADNLAADLPAGVLASRVGDEVDAIEGKLLHLGGGIDIRLALHVDECGGLLRKQFPVCRRIAPEHVGDGLRLRRRIGDFGRVRIDCRRVNALREHRTIAVVDRASVGCGGERNRARFFGHRRIMGRLNDLEIPQAQKENCGDSGKDKQKDEGAVRIHPLGSMACVDALGSAANRSPNGAADGTNGADDTGKCALGRSHPAGGTLIAGTARASHIASRPRRARLAR